jgi:hypothetical protein
MLHYILSMHTILFENVYPYVNYNLQIDRRPRDKMRILSKYCHVHLNDLAILNDSAISSHSLFLGMSRLSFYHDFRSRGLGDVFSNKMYCKLEIYSWNNDNQRFPSHAC